MRRIVALMGLLAVLAAAGCGGHKPADNDKKQDCWKTADVNGSRHCATN